MFGMNQSSVRYRCITLCEGLLHQYCATLCVCVCAADCSGLRLQTDDF